MKTLVPEQKLVIAEVSEEGLESFIGKNVLLMCVNYFYTGKLVGVNQTCVKLDNPRIIFETGSWDTAKYQSAAEISKGPWYIQTSAIESFGLSKEG